MGDATRLTCSIEDCPKPTKNRGWCSAHYEKWRLHGDPLYRHWTRTLTLWDRFWLKVDAEGDCWLWTATVNHHGYGQIGTVGRKLGMAHRVGYELLVGPIAPGLELDHLCRNPRCVNPDHLEPVTHAENMRRAPWTAPNSKRAKTHCPHGHPYSGDNLFVNKRGRRECRTCRRQRS